MTADLAQTALDFCHECLGWEDAYHSGDGYIVSRSRNKVWTPSNSVDLTMITTEVQNWCKTHYCQWAVFGNSRHESFEYLAFLLPFDDFWEARCEDAPTPQYALMAACVEAARKLKATA